MLHQYKQLNPSNKLDIHLHLNLNVTKETRQSVNDSSASVSPTTPPVTIDCDLWDSPTCSQLTDKKNREAPQQQANHHIDSIESLLTHNKRNDKKRKADDGHQDSLRGSSSFPDISYMTAKPIGHVDNVEKKAAQYIAKLRRKTQRT